MRKWRRVERVEKGRNCDERKRRIKKGEERDVREVR